MHQELFASARNRKAGQNTQSPSVPYPEPTNGTMIPPGVIPPAAPTKISIPQAIQMLGNRIDIFRNKFTISKLMVEVVTVI